MTRPIKRLIILIALLTVIALWIILYRSVERSTYDSIMLVVNFGILVLLFIKFAKNPLKDFLENRKLEAAREIRRIEDEKKEWLDKIESAKKELEDSETRFEQIKQRMIDQGERKKQELIDSAKKQSETMIDKAKQKIDNDIVRAKNALRSELVDAAMDLAAKNLPSEINEKDKDKFIEEYLSSLNQK